MSTTVPSQLKDLEVVIIYSEQRRFTQRFWTEDLWFELEVATWLSMSLFKLTLNKNSSKFKQEELQVKIHLHLMNMVLPKEEFKLDLLEHLEKVLLKQALHLQVLMVLIKAPEP